MKRPLVVIILPEIIAIPGGSVARNGDDEAIGEKIIRQHVRIDEGIARGQLTLREAEVLQGNLNRIKAEEAGLSADGGLTPREMARLHRALDRNSEMIRDKRRTAQGGWS